MCHKGGFALLAWLTVDARAEMTMNDPLCGWLRSRLALAAAFARAAATRPGPDRDGQDVVTPLPQTRGMSMGRRGTCVSAGDSGVFHG